MRKRSLAREIALQNLYQREFSDSEFYRPGNADSDIQQFASEIVEGVKAKQGEIDRLIRQTSDNWKLERLAAIDRIILRIAIYEIVFRPDIPPAVSINEAVDLAKKYSTKDSGAFVNGVLDKIAKAKKA